MTVRRFDFAQRGGAASRRGRGGDDGGRALGAAATSRRSACSPTCWPSRRARAAGASEAWLVGRDGWSPRAARPTRGSSTRTGCCARRADDARSCRGDARRRCCACAGAIGHGGGRARVHRRPRRSAREAFITSTTNPCCPWCGSTAQRSATGTPGPVARRLAAAVVGPDRGADRLSAVADLRYGRRRAGARGRRESAPSGLHPRRGSRARWRRRRGGRRATAAGSRRSSPSAGEPWRRSTASRSSSIARRSAIEVEPLGVEDRQHPVARGAGRLAARRRRSALAHRSAHDRAAGLAHRGEHRIARRAFARLRHPPGRRHLRDRRGRPRSTTARARDRALTAAAPRRASA